MRRELRRRGIKAVIPEKSNQVTARKRRGTNGGRPPGFDPTTYKGRNVVERSFALAKQWRALATRYDKLAITYRAAVTLSAILTWLHTKRRHALEGRDPSPRSNVGVPPPL